jgi:hypothetical protein
MKLYLVHCGFYDASLCDGIYESHVNFFVAANDFEDAKAKAKELSEFQSKRMHIDGLHEVSAVGGARVELNLDESLNGQTILIPSKHRDLAAVSLSKPLSPSDSSGSKPQGS